MATKQLLYVHGAGRQPAPATMKAQLDRRLFGAPLATSRLAYYANVRWPAPGGGVAAAPGGSGRARRAAAVRQAASPALSPKAAAETVVTASLARRRTTGLGVASAASRREATALVQRLYEHADRVARRTSGHGPGLALGFPDPIFRIVVGLLASDVVDYLYGGFKAAMRAPVEQALRTGPRPDIVVAHSLGTIITYDVLSEPTMRDRVPDVLVTLGCPLGIDNVQDRLRDGAGKPNPVPPTLKSWSNFADRFDPVALDATLRDEFRPPKDFIVDDEVNNQAKNNHDLNGYLTIGVVRSLIRSTVGVV